MWLASIVNKNMPFFKKKVILDTFQHLRSTGRTHTCHAKHWPTSTSPPLPIIKNKFCWPEKETLSRHIYSEHCDHLPVTAHLRQPSRRTPFLGWKALHAFTHLPSKPYLWSYNNCLCLKNVELFYQTNINSSLHHEDLSLMWICKQHGETQRSWLDSFSWLRIWLIQSDPGEWQHWSLLHGSCFTRVLSMKRNIKQLLLGVSTKCIRGFIGTCI